MKYLYLHGLGQKPDSWDRVIKETTVSDRSASLSLAEMLEDKAATYGELYTAFSEECNKENDEIVLCGISLGAVLALNYAIDHPDKVKALVLIAAQYKMPKKLLKFQNMLFRFMPNTMFKQFGYLCYRNTLHKLQDYVAVNSINQYHIFIHTNSVEVIKYEWGIK